MEEEIIQAEIVDVDVQPAPKKRGRPKGSKSSYHLTKPVPKGENQPATGRGGKYNFPTARPEIKTEEDRAMVSNFLGEVLDEYKKPKVKSDEELEDRINQYFIHCATVGQIPTVEELCMTTGYTVQMVNAWERGQYKGFSPRTKDIIIRAKNVLRTFDAKMVIEGKLNFLAYCFRAKNYYGMQDKTEYVLTPNTSPLDQEYDAEAIKKKYISDD